MTSVVNMLCDQFGITQWLTTSFLCVLCSVADGCCSPQELCSAAADQAVYWAKAAARSLLSYSSKLPAQVTQEVEYLVHNNLSYVVTFETEWHALLLLTYIQMMSYDIVNHNYFLEIWMSAWDHIVISSQQTVRIECFQYRGNHCRFVQ